MPKTLSEAVQDWLDALVAPESKLPEDWEMTAYQIQGPGSRKVYQDGTGDLWSYSGEGAIDHLLGRLEEIMNFAHNWRFTLRVSDTYEFLPGSTVQKSFAHICSAATVSNRLHDEAWGNERKTYQATIMMLQGQLKESYGTIASLTKVIRDLGGDVRTSANEPLKMMAPMIELLQSCIAQTRITAELTAIAGQKRGEAYAMQDPILQAQARSIDVASSPAWKILGEVLPPVLTQLGIPAAAALLGLPPDLMEAYGIAAVNIAKSALPSTQPDPTPQVTDGTTP